MHSIELEIAWWIKAIIKIKHIFPKKVRNRSEILGVC